MENIAEDHVPVKKKRARAKRPLWPKGIPTKTETYALDGVRKLLEPALKPGESVAAKIEGARRYEIDVVLNALHHIAIETAHGRPPRKPAGVFWRVLDDAGYRLAEGTVPNPESVADLVALVSGSRVRAGAPTPPSMPEERRDSAGIAARLATKFSIP